MRIGLFTESDFHTRGGRAAAVAALAAYRPHDVCIKQYSAPPGRGALRNLRQIVRQVEADRIDVVHVATSGPLAIGALIIASRFGLPIVASCAPPTATTSRTFALYLRAIVRQCRRLLVTSMSAREMFVRANIDASKIVVWRPGVDSAMFAPSCAVRRFASAGECRTPVPPSSVPFRCQTIVGRSAFSPWSLRCIARGRCTR